MQGQEVTKTRYKTKEEDVAAASLPDDYLPWAEQFLQDEGEIQCAIGMGVPIRTSTTLFNAMLKQLQHMGSEPDVWMIEDPEATEILRTSTCKACFVKREKRQKRQMLCDSGCLGGHINQTDLNDTLQHATQSKTMIQTAAKGELPMRAEMDGTLPVRIFSPNKRETPIRMKLPTTTAAVRQELLSVPCMYEQGYNILWRRPGYEGGRCEFYKEATSTEPESSIPVKWDDEEKKFVVVYEVDAEKMQSTRYVHAVSGMATNKNYTDEEVRRLAHNLFSQTQATEATDRIGRHQYVKRTIEVNANTRAKMKGHDPNPTGHEATSEEEDTGILCQECGPQQVVIENETQRTQQDDAAKETHIPEARAADGVRLGLKARKRKLTSLQYHCAHGHLDFNKKCKICASMEAAAWGVERPIRSMPPDPPREHRPLYHLTMDKVILSHWSLQGNKYMITIRDKMSDYIWQIPIGAQSATPDAMFQWVANVRSDPDFTCLGYEPIVYITTDNDSTWGLNTAFKSDLQERYSIKLVLNEPGRHQPNGHAEATNKMVERTMKAMMMQANVPPDHWEMFSRAAVWLLNRHPMESRIQALDGTAPLPIEMATSTRYSRRQVERELSYFVQPATPAMVHVQEVKGSALKPKVRWGVATGMYRDQVRWKCPFTSANFKSKSFTAFELNESVNYLDFLGLTHKQQPIRKELPLPGEMSEKVTLTLPTPKPNQVQVNTPVLRVADTPQIAKPQIAIAEIRHRAKPLAGNKLGGSIQIKDHEGNQLVTDKHGIVYRLRREKGG